MSEEMRMYATMFDVYSDDQLFREIFFEWCITLLEILNCLKLLVAYESIVFLTSLHDKRINFN